MYKFIFLFVVFCSTLISEEEAINTYLTSEVDNLSLVEGVVNAQNGRLVQIDRDIHIQGSDPLEFIRYYDGGHDHKGVCGYGFGFSFPIISIFDGDKNELKVEQRGGSSLPFDMIEKKQNYFEGKIKSFYITNGYTNCCEGLLRGEKDVSAITVKGSKKSSFVVDLGNGLKRHYGLFKNKENKYGLKYFRLCLEERGSGNLRYFDYGDEKNSKSPTRIWTTNKNQSLTLNWMNFEYGKNGVNVHASNGENVFYELSTTDVTAKKLSDRKSKEHKLKLLWEVSGKHLLTTNYHLKQKKNYSASIFEIPYIKRPDGRNLHFEYDDEERVKKIRVAGVTKSLYTFDYHKDHTIVIDGLKNKRRYDFKKQRLLKYKEPTRSHYYDWSKTGQLQSHSIKDLKTNKVTLQQYAYDALGNITEAKVTGNITQNGSKDLYVVRYTHSQDGRNNVIKENHNHEREFIYDYQPDTNLVIRKLTFADQGFVEREFSDYDENAILIKKIVDDGSTSDGSNLAGVSYRLITEIEPQLNPNLPGMTLPKVIKEYYLDIQTGQQHLLKKVEKTYTQGDLLAEDHVFDANGNYCYSNLFEYNDRKELVKEIDAYGVATVCQYDENKNKIYVEKLGSQKKSRYVYDLANRLIEEIEEHENGRVLKTSHTYDVMGNCISTTNHLGQTTTYTYDASGREISSCDPLGLCEHKEYDAKGNIIKSIDKDGFVTLTSYNIHGKPLEICYPDGTTKRFAYNLQGHLIQEWERDNRSTIYEVDYRGNAKNSRIYGSDGALKKQHQKTFKGSKVISEVDSMGNVTSYKYDGAGRKVSETKEDQTTYYEYDNLGNLFKTIDAETVEIKIYDFLGRVVEERTEDLFGQIYEKSRKSYDINGNCISNRIYKNSSDFTESKTIYNSENLPILQIDALGNQTTIAYRYTDHLEKQVHDPMGRKEVTIYDQNNRIHAIHRLSANHEHLACRSFSYDGRNNKTIQQERIYYQGEECGYFTVSATYDSMSQKISEIEQNEKKTTYIYKNGKLHQTHKPDGVVLTYLYNALGCLVDLISSEGTIHYRYHYDLNDNLILSEDLIHHKTTNRIYDKLNRLVFEKQATGFEVSYSYDKLDRLTQMEFQDEKVIYTYSTTNLISSSRYKKDKLIYSFNQEINWNGKAISQSLPNELSISYEWDELNRCSSIKSNPYSQSFIYNAVSNITSTIIADPEGIYDTHFSYDDLNQISEEKGHFNNTYIFDSLNNRRNKNGEVSTLDDLNRLTSDSINSYGSDKNGYRTSKNEFNYSYDALGRLLSVSLNDDTITYSYDSFSRRLSRTSDHDSVQYLYQFDTEIAALANNKIVEFKAIHGQFSPYAIELNDKVYTPLRNHRGDITVLLDSEQNAVSTYRYDAFGEFTQYGLIQSPWLFSSQRYDTSTKNYHFINREYDSYTGRWLTPDPLGFEDGLNLYAYVHNNPMVYVDPYGLWAEDSNGYWSRTGEFSHSFSRGFVDDFTFGVTSLTMGEHETPTFNSKAAYYTGTTCSLAAGLLYGATWVKGAAYTGRGINYGCKLLRNVFKLGTKPLGETCKIVQSTLKQTASTQVLRKTLGLETKIGKESGEIGKQIWTSTKNRSPVKNALEHWKDHKSEFPELTNSKQYVERMRELFQSTENTLTKFRSNGEMLRYQPDSNTFGVFNKENIPKTMFRPTEGMYYWLNGN